MFDKIDEFQEDIRKLIDSYGFDSDDWGIEITISDEQLRESMEDTRCGMMWRYNNICHEHRMVATYDKISMKRHPREWKIVS